MAKTAIMSRVKEENQCKNHSKELRDDRENSITFKSPSICDFL